MPTTPQEILDFWLTEVGPKGWYDKSDDLDAAITRRFLPAWQALWESGSASGWGDNPDSALAAIILADQFPRNMFRGDGRSYATDSLARDLAGQAVAAGHDLAIEGPARQFVYMPWMHSEDLADQDRAVAAFAERLPGDNERHARAHRAVIARFGRFPWRNADLGRSTTPEEQAFMEAGGYGALLRGEVVLEGS